MPAARIPRTVARSEPKPRFRRRSWHLAFVRQLPCVVCGSAGPSEVAHVRSGSDGGVGMKPADRYIVSLCRDCHSLQHQVNWPSGAPCASIRSTSRFDCGQYPAISRPGREPSSGRDRRSTCWKTT